MGQLEKRVRAVLHKAGKRPIASGELRRRANVKKVENEEYKTLLERMTREGELVGKEKGLSLAGAVGAERATIIKVKPRFGFARIDGAGRDVFVPGRQLMGSMPGDRVMVRVSRSDGELDAGEVMSVMERAQALVSGTVAKNEMGDLEVVPDSTAYSPIQLDASGAPCAIGDKVVVRIATHGDSHRDHRAVVTASFGSGALAKNCVGAIVAAAGLEPEFSPEVLTAAQQSAAQKIPQAERDRRLDLRKEPIMTIDGADTKDIDDAVSLQKTATGWELGVHIADVSRYVQAGSLLDQDAYERGTSVYFADSVIPMLPPALSNGACSLNPGEDRLAFSALMTLDRSGALINYKFRKTLIRSRVKGVYAEINQILDGSADQPTLDKYQGLTDMLADMRELAAMLGQNRTARGSMELSSVETKFLLDSEGRVIDLLPRIQGVSENMIEEFMLTANEAAALLARSASLPFLFRVHEPPSPEKLATLKELLDSIGIASEQLDTDTTPAILSEILRTARQTPFGAVVNSTMLRTMQKARYDAKNLGHYGLALNNYAHFTSPIRRYPDLAIHRILTAFAEGTASAEIQKQFGEFAESASKQSSVAEVRAMGVERSCADCYKAEYLHSHLGETFEGVVTSVLAHGVYVMLDNTAEGLVRTERLGDGMVFDGRMQYSMPDGSRRCRVGDRIRILVAAADVATGRVDFELAPETV